MAAFPIVDHIQTHFADFSGLPDERQQDAGPGDDSSLPQVSRAPLPLPLRQPDVESAVPADQSGPWVIEGEVPPPDHPTGIDVWGADVLAFYLPFHFYRTNWGIYLLSSGVIYLACILKGHRTVSERIMEVLGGRLVPARLKRGDERFLRLAELVLWEHEAFHFAAEIAAARSELIAKTRVYRPYFSNRAATAHEEAVANAQAVIRGVKNQAPSIRDRVHDWMKGQGPGYRDFHRWLPARAFSGGASRTAEFVINCIPPPQTIPALGGFLFRGTRGYPIPTRRVEDVTGGAAGVLRPFPKDFGMQVFTHPNDHPPPHVHIQRPPGGRKTRYRWPDLIPLKGDFHLTGSARKDLHRYVEKYRAEIEERVQRIYGSR